MNHGVSLVYVMHEMISQVYGRGPKAPALGKDAEMRPGKCAVKDVAQRFEIIGGGTDEYSRNAQCHQISIAEFGDVT